MWEQALMAGASSGGSYGGGGGTSLQGGTSSATAGNVESHISTGAKFSKTASPNDTLLYIGGALAVVLALAVVSKAVKK
jgi:hypothetical protein